MSPEEKIEAAEKLIDEARAEQRTNTDGSRAEVLLQLMSDGWQVGASAPRDGTAFLGLVVHGGTTLRLPSIIWRGRGCWHATDSRDHQYGGWHSLDDSCFDLWRPIPGTIQVIGGAR